MWKIEPTKEAVPALVRNAEGLPICATERINRIYSVEGPSFRGCIAAGEIQSKYTSLSEDILVLRIVMYDDLKHSSPVEILEREEILVLPYCTRFSRPSDTICHVVVHGDELDIRTACQKKENTYRFNVITGNYFLLG